MYRVNKCHVCEERRLSVIIDEKAADDLITVGCQCYADNKKIFSEGNIYASLSGILFTIFISCIKERITFGIYL